MNAMGGAVTVEYAINMTIALGNTASRIYKISQAGPNPSTGKMVGIQFRLLGASISLAGAMAGAQVMWQLNAVGGALGVAGTRRPVRRRHAKVIGVRLSPPGLN